MCKGGRIPKGAWERAQRRIKKRLWAVWRPRRCLQGTHSLGIDSKLDGKHMRRHRRGSAAPPCNTAAVGRVLPHRRDGWDEHARLRNAAERLSNEIGESSGIAGNNEKSIETRVLLVAQRRGYAHSRTDRGNLRK
ncbi:hypothetical protein OE88DRAFT_1643219 [Heliocybe sulcata]|uniref:Uncharacterized protein n=1 Tax=Heliocybe sulcata TaxID=5364 RepID=A0A5C3N8P4_9AGAM|nr:hypothetical protein OE88DRAFT_1643219 [Heliocybe sulcata]